MVKKLIVITIIISFFFIFFIFAIIFFGIFIFQGIYLPKDLEGKGQLFSINKGEDIFTIGDNLKKSGLIKEKYSFILYSFLSGKYKKLKAGKYFLSPKMSVKSIVDKIFAGDIAKKRVTIPEGFTVKQIEELLGLDLPGENLEGFLFPDTYDFYIDIKGEEVVKIMKKNFERKLNQELKEEIERQGKTIFEIITMASLIEKEVKTKEDKEIVSGILWKRLSVNMPLQVDATINYITGKKTTRISIEETKIDSPYNTYLNTGLPPGPIANPGLESIKAALYPKSSDYWYYLSTPDGKTIFSKTLQEHNLAKAKYLK